MYKNFIFDFGQVIVKFEPEYMTSAYVKNAEDVKLVKDIAFDRLYWDKLDAGIITDEEVIRVANYVGKQPSPDYFDEFAFETMSESSNGNSNFDDALYDDVKAFVIAQQKASTSLIQRNFGIGYNRAARIIDSLEAHGIIGPMSGSKPREVYTQPDPDLDY